MPQGTRQRKKLVLIALNAAILLIVAGGSIAYGVLNHSVTLVVDGRSEKIRTFGDDVADVLAAKKIDVRAGDHLNMARTASLGDGDRIQVAYAKPLTMTVDGRVTSHTVYDRTIGQALTTLGVDPTSGAYVSVDRARHIPRGGADVVVSRPKTIAVVADGKKATVSTPAPTVEGVLKAAHITLDADDEVRPAEQEYVTPSTRLRVVRIQKVTKVQDVDVKFPVEVREDDSLLKGVKKVATPGKPGTTREEVALVLADGKVRARQVLTSRTLSEPRPQIETHGTKAAPDPNATGDTVWDKIAKCESGGNWSINTGNGYYGGLQFSAATWHSVGGSGLPSENSRAEQIKRAKILQARSGWGQWGCAGARFN